MPHLVLEYSSNLEEKINIRGVCFAISGAISGIMDRRGLEIGAVSVRAYACHHHVITGQPENSFIDMSLRIGKGRIRGKKKSVGAEILAATERILGDLFETPPIALSLEIREIDPDLSWRRNAMHARFQSATH